MTLTEWLSACAVNSEYTRSAEIFVCKDIRPDQIKMVIPHTLVTLRIKANQGSFVVAGSGESDTVEHAFELARKDLRIALHLFQRTVQGASEGGR